MSGLSAAFSGSRGGFALDAAIEAPAGTVTALFGPSGSGKTSMLRAIAGLERFSGRCALDGEVWQDGQSFLPPHRRAIGYVFQEASLFPHLSVRRNLEYGMRRTSGGSGLGFDEAVALLGLEALIERSPAALSGGERQRVALGRALLSQPQLLLLDEPLSGLDRGAKEEILPYFEALHPALDIPVLLVTHDIAEVERLAGRLILLRQGGVVGQGPLNDVLVGEALGLRTEREAASVLAGRIAGFDRGDGLSEIDLGGGRLLLAGKAGDNGAGVRVRIAARDVSLAVESPSATTILNLLAVTIVAIEEVGEAEAIVTLQLGAQKLLARVTRRSVRQLGLAAGQSAFAQVKGVSLLSSPLPRGRGEASL